MSEASVCGRKRHGIQKESGVCFPKCGVGQYLFADMYGSPHYTQCVSKVAAGEVCLSNRYNRIAKNIYCRAGLCRGDHCCDSAAALTTGVGAQFCTLCSLSTGSCAQREACPPCAASGAIKNGVASPCTSSLAAGTACEPTCNGRYILSGNRMCIVGILTDTAACCPDSCFPGGKFMSTYEADVKCTET